MPPRWLSLAIILFWLVVTSFLVWHDLLPQWLPGQPPPYTIELVEEARNDRPAILWAVLEDGVKVARARTRITHPSRSRDVFELRADITPDKRDTPFSVNGILVNELKSTYRVNSAGDLLGLSVHIDGKIDLSQPLFAYLLRLLGGAVGKVETGLVLNIEGTVENGWMTPHLQGKLHGLPLASKKLARDLPTVEVPRGGAVLLPLHPVNRLRGLKPGQTWQMRILDPLGDSLSAYRLPGDEQDARILRARVRPKEEYYTHGRFREVPCLVIDYEGEMQATTWVARDNGLVMAQEATLDKNRWVMYRE
jgi:hypothetical protein